ncbi:MAG: hypothetical protein AAFN48_09025, partial [Pseudomonadota bacterium]
MTHESRFAAKFIPTALASVVFLALTACGEEVAEESVQPVTVIGSSTVYPFAQRVAEQVVSENEGMAAPD